ncbi:MAG: TetR/AcrR family transcriptional regulator [Pseudomonadota bacterium]
MPRTSSTSIEEAPPAKRLTSKGLKTRSAILDAAERQFSERGFEGVSLRQIMDEAGVQMGQLQHYFPTKEDVFVGVLDRRLEQVTADYAAAVEGMEASVKAGQADLRAVVRAVMSVSRAWLSADDAGRHRYLRMLALSTMSFDQPDYVRSHGQSFQPLNERIIRQLARLYPQAGAARTRAAYYLIEANLLSVYANVDSQLARSRIVRSADAIADLYDHLEDFLVGGIDALLGRADRAS